MIYENQKYSFFYKKSFKVISTLLVITLLVIIPLIFFIQKDNRNDSLINLSELSDEFMDKYLEDYAKMAEENNLENVLIVTSKTLPADTFGATNIVNAPNNQFFLQYPSEEERSYAYSQFSLDPSLKVAQNFKVKANVTANSSYNSWGIEKMGLNHAKELVEKSPSKSEVGVAILDTGLNYKTFSKNFSGRFGSSYNVLTGKTSSSPKDKNGHGTHVSGIIAEGTPSNVKIYSIKVLDDYGSGFDTDIATGINYAVKSGKVHIINLSLGCSLMSKSDVSGCKEIFKNSGEKSALEAAKSQGVIAVAAAGNVDYKRKVEYPAAADTTIAVSALELDLKLAEFSSYGSEITFAAPGVDIKSINGAMSGTSQATPHVAAAAAIAKSLKKDLSFENTIKFLATYAQPLDKNKKSNYYGYGLINFSDTYLCSEAKSCDEFSILGKGEKIPETQIDPLEDPADPVDPTYLEATSSTPAFFNQKTTVHKSMSASSSNAYSNKSPSGTEISINSIQGTWSKLSLTENEKTYIGYVNTPKNITLKDNLSAFTSNSTELYTSTNKSNKLTNLSQKTALEVAQYTQSDTLYVKASNGKIGFIDMNNVSTSTTATSTKSVLSISDSADKKIIEIILLSESLLGTKGFACSDFITYLLKTADINLENSSVVRLSSSSKGKNINSINNLQLGDIVFYNPNGGEIPSHAGIYVGDGEIIEASQTHQEVIKSQLPNSFINARRFIY